MKKKHFMNKQKIFFILLTLSLICYLSPGSSTASEPQKSILANGLTVIHKETGYNDIVAVDIFIKAGSLVENDKQAGITNFLQRLLLKGTTSRTAEQLAKDIGSLGGIIDFNSAEDYAELYLVIPKENFDEGLRILLDVLMNPGLATLEIEKERTIILGQIKSQQDSIFSVSYDLLNETLYGNYPYHKQVLGNQKTISSVKREDLVNFHQKVYVPQNMVLVVVGNIKEKRILKQLKAILHTVKKIDSIPETRILSKPQDELLPERNTPYEKSYRRTFKQAYLMMGYLMPPGDASDYPVLKVINAILGGGMGSRLFVNLRDKQGLAYEIGSFYPTRILKSKFVIYMGLDASNMAKAKTGILDELRQLKEHLPDQEELKAIKNYLKGTYILAHQTNKDQAWYLGWNEIIGKGYLYDDLYVRDLEKVTPEDINFAANKYFKDNNRILIQLLPKEK
jgi:zinc protease